MPGPFGKVIRAPCVTSNNPLFNVRETFHGPSAT